MDAPVLKVELYKKLETDDLGGFNLTPVDISSLFSGDTRAGIETTKDTFSLRISNNLLLSTGSFDLQADKENRREVDMRVGDMVKIYGYYAADGFDGDNDLIMVGTINSYSHSNTEDGNNVVFKGVNRSEQLLQGYALGTFDISDAENTSPLILNFIIKRLRSYGPDTYDRKIYSAMDNEYIYDEKEELDSSTAPTGITGSYGSVQHLTEKGNAFKTISYRKIWQPTYKIIEELSKVENTGDDDAGAYLFYIKNTAVLPQFQQKLRTKTINEVVWKPVNKSVSNTIERGIDYLNITSTKDTFDVKNILIVKCGTDLEGNGITAFAINTESVGKAGPKFGYLPLPNIVTNIIAEEKKVTGPDSDIGSTWNTIGYPDDVIDNNNMPWHFATINTRSADYPYNETTTAAEASTKDDFNTVIRTEARAQGIQTAQDVVNVLGEPRFKAKVELTRGSVGSYTMGDLLKITDHSVGWWNTDQDPAKKLRIHDISHSFGDDWTTTLSLEEDEKAVKDKYPVE